MDKPEIVSVLKDLRGDLLEIKERLIAVEVEQRRIREDLLSGEPQSRMKKRILQNKSEDIKKLKNKIDEEINIKI